MSLVEIVVERGVPTTVRDGTVLRSDVYRPADGDARPVLLQRTPYDKSISLLTSNYPGLEPLVAVERGFVVMIQDVRGRGSSDGTFVPFRHEADDGYDTLEWLTRQPWCDGRVVMFGQSYYGLTQFAAAASGHPALRGIVPSLTSPYVSRDWITRGGAFQLGFTLLWTAKDLEPMPDVLARPDAEYDSTPLDGSRVARRVGYFADWTRRPGATVRFDQLPGVPSVAGLHVGGWFDLFLDGTLAAFETMAAAGERPQQLVVGPWAHGNLGDVVGARDFGPQAAQSVVAMTETHLEFARAAVDGDDPPGASVRIFVMGPDRWYDFPSWPPPGAQPSVWYLHGASTSGDGALSPDPPPADGPDATFPSDPGDPVPSIAGATFLPGGAVSRSAGPRDRNELVRRPDVLQYLSDPLTRRLTLIGPVEVVLWFASTGADADAVVALVDVDESGAAWHVTDGVLRASTRVPGERIPLPAGEPVELHIALHPTAWQLPAGHRLGLHIAGSDFPRYDRNPHRLLSPGSATPDDWQPAQHHVVHQPARASRLVVSVLDQDLTATHERDTA